MTPAPDRQGTAATYKPLPCPFCGGTVRIVDLAGYESICNGCNATGPLPSFMDGKTELEGLATPVGYDTYEGVLKLWNRRSPAPAATFTEQELFDLSVACEYLLKGTALTKRRTAMRDLTAKLASLRASGEERKR